jgi:Aspartyl protease
LIPAKETPTPSCQVGLIKIEKETVIPEDPIQTHPQRHLQSMVNGIKTLATIDSGSTCYAVSLPFAQKAGLKINTTETVSTTFGNETSNTSLGTTKIHLILMNYEEMFTAQVFTNLSHEIILGMPWISQHEPQDWSQATMTIKHLDKRISIDTLPLNYEEPSSQDITLITVSQMNRTI